MSREPLIVIDMQPDFISNRFPLAAKQIISNVIRQCRLAVQRNDHILFVEYDVSPTLIGITRTVSSYPKKLVVKKYDSNGGHEVQQALQDRNIKFDALRVCGVFLSHCVFQTTKSLAKRYPRKPIKVVRNAVGNGAFASYAAGIGYRRGLEEIAKIKGVKLIGAHL
jgi:nicotinamidase-related amidase